MAYIDLVTKAGGSSQALTAQPKADSPCLGDCGRTTLGDPLTSLSQALGTTPQTLLLVGGGGLVAGWLLNDLFTDVGRGVKNARRSLRKKRSQLAMSKPAAALQSSVPMWQVLLVAGVVGGAVWYVASRKSGA